MERLQSMGSGKLERFEYKFYISKHEAEILALRLDQLLKRDPFSPYQVLSLYFDNYQKQSLWDKLSGNTLRRKYRLRTYCQKNRTKTIKFEIKERLWHKIKKTSWIISESLARTFITEDTYKILSKIEKEKDLKTLYLLLARSPLDIRITTGVKYYRRAWEWPFGKLRITLDENLCSFSNFKAFLNDEDFISKPILFASKCILEIKFHEIFPSVYLCIFEDIPKVYSAISKFVFCNLGCADIVL